MKMVIAALLFLAAFMLWPAPKKSIPFSKEAIYADVPYNAKWAGRDLYCAQEIQAALSQTYRHLGNGGQCYAFVSSDDRYVIKFFKQKAFAIPPWMRRLPLWFKEKKIRKKEEFRSSVFNAFKLSFDHLSEETGILYVHLNKTSHLNKTLSLTDPQGQNHQLDLDELEFVVQKKAELAVHRIDSLMQAKDVEGAKQAIDELLKLNLTLCQKGFRNRDPNFRSNCGFIGEKAILIDVGRVVQNQKISIPQTLAKATPKFRKYLTENHPELLEHFEEGVAKVAL